MRNVFVVGNINHTTMKIGFIGQGYIGKNYADDFENRGYSVVRYALEKPYNSNESKIKECDVVFIAVPTPTTPKGFDDSIVRAVIKLVSDGKIAVIKSTVLPGTTESIQEENRNIVVFYSPEFLLETTAAYDAKHPIMNIIGITGSSKNFRSAEFVLSLLPESSYKQICRAREAEFIKYTHNCRAYAKIVMANLLYDLAQKLDCRWEEIKKGMDADPMFSNWYNQPVHKSGRGAGGNCFIKDFEAFRQLYADKLDDELGSVVLESIKNKNVALLRGSNKDTAILKGVYGKSGGKEKKK